MKKQYINPETTVIAIDTQKHLMAGSVFETLYDTPVGDDTEGFVQYSRGNSLWDYED
ncbi:MAG: hypothetical protein IJ544_00225 [Prevotella sp.]|nr:hypothetical protein [Prevotella sp.]MBR1412206.1 hypothetical protein [Prevotella sp.]